MSINIIPQDLRQEEMVLQIEDTLATLKKMSDQVFSRIESGITHYKKELEEIDERAGVAREKVEQLKSSKNKAIKIFSSHKYPSSDDDNRLYSALCPFTFSDEGTVKRFGVKSTHIPFDDEVLKEKLQFYQVPKLRLSRSVDPSEGPLGSIPWERITSISSLVMFNSSENPYCGRDGSSVVESKMKKKTHGVDETDAVSSPPLTVSAEEPVTDLFKYNPDLEAAPKIIDFLPAALPDLPGIADILFDDEADVTGVTPQSNSHKAVREEPVLVEPVLLEPVLVEQTEVSVPKSGPRVDSMAPSVVPVVVPVVEKPASPSSGPPPPPPPLPPPSPPQEEKRSGALSGDSGRASLLDAIRKAGGKPKKGSGGASKELKIERKMEKKKEVVSTDLMADLANKLKARRTGISGAEERKPPSAMDRVASMIPPPPKPTAVTDQEEDSDWE